MRNWIAILILLGSWTLTAQVNFSVNVGTSHGPVVLEDFDIRGIEQEVVRASDSLQLLNTYVLDFWQSVDYEPKFGYFGNIQLGFPVSERLTVEAGLGVELQRFELINAFSNERRGDLIRQDSFPFDPAENPPFLTIADCDKFENAPSDFDIDPARQYDLWYFTLPIGANYELIPDKLSVRAGVQVQMMISARLQATNLTFERASETDGETCCRYTTVDIDQQNQSSFENFFLSGNFEAQYHLTERFRITAGVQQQFNNLFSTPPAQQVNSPERLWRPLRFTVGGRYFLNQPVDFASVQAAKAER